MLSSVIKIGRPVFGSQRVRKPRRVGGVLESNGRSEEPTVQAGAGVLLHPPERCTEARVAEEGDAPGQGDVEAERVRRKPEGERG